MGTVKDISELGASGYRAEECLREHHHIDAHPFDHQCISAQRNHADNERTTKRPLTALCDQADHAAESRTPRNSMSPPPADLRIGPHPGY
ncbi:hypothetical protein AB0C70_26945 [Streptomyces sp. NPDC048564]|uniref:hypothetical protein n=1 Tax=unclassified Streptomyces TaxID=2593676 RepID=UPI0033FC50EA